MRITLVLLPLLLSATPALAQPAPPPPVAPLPRELTDPATADRLADAMQGLSQALLDLKVGDIKAALDGRRATPAERQLTVRDLGRRKDPNFDRDVEQQVAQARPMMRQSIRAVNEALPAVTNSLRQASNAIERALANMPDPTYPRR
jgi:hypothetical protein